MLWTPRQCRSCCNRPTAKWPNGIDDAGQLSVSMSRLRVYHCTLVGHWCEAAAHGVFRDCAREQKLEQIVGPAGLGADAGKLESAERLPVHQRAGDLAIDV